MLLINFKEEYARKRINNGCSVRIENSVTRDNCSALLGLTVTFVTEFSIRTSRPFKILIFYQPLALSAPTSSRSTCLTFACGTAYQPRSSQHQHSRSSRRGWLPHFHRPKNYFYPVLICPMDLLPHMYISDMRENVPEDHSAILEDEDWPWILNHRLVSAACWLTGNIFGIKHCLRQKNDLCDDYFTNQR